MYKSSANYGSLTPLVCILVVRQLDMHEQGLHGNDVQSLALTTRQLAVRMQATPLEIGSKQASDA